MVELSRCFAPPSQSLIAQEEAGLLRKFLFGGFDYVAYVSIFGVGNRKLLVGTSITWLVSPTSGNEDKESVKSWAMLDLNGVGEQGQ